MARREIRAVEMVRKIREQIAAQLVGKSDEEVIAFFNAAGRRAAKRADALRARKATAAKRRVARKAKRK